MRPRLVLAAALALSGCERMPDFAQPSPDDVAAPPTTVDEAMRMVPAARRGDLSRALAYLVAARAAKGAATPLDVTPDLVMRIDARNARDRDAICRGAG